MVKNVQDLKPDTVLKNYWSDNDQFAYLFNAMLFGGSQVLRPEELTDADTEESSVLEHRDSSISMQASRDNIKICKKSTIYGVEFVILDRSLVREEAKKKVIDYASEHAVDRSVIMNVARAANCRIDYDVLSRKEDFDMCTLFEEIARESEKTGEARGETGTSIKRKNNGNHSSHHGSSSAFNHSGGGKRRRKEHTAYNRCLRGGGEKNRGTETGYDRPALAPSDHVRGLLSYLAG